MLGLTAVPTALMSSLREQTAALTMVGNVLSWNADGSTDSSCVRGRQGWQEHEAARGIVNSIAARANAAPAQHPSIRQGRGGAHNVPCLPALRQPTGSGQELASGGRRLPSMRSLQRSLQQGRSDAPSRDRRRCSGRNTCRSMHRARLWRHHNTAGSSYSTAAPPLAHPPTGGRFSRQKPHSASRQAQRHQNEGAAPPSLSPPPRPVRVQELADGAARPSQGS